MTEAEWVTCADPDRMLEFLHGKASDRKLRLFAVACCYLCPAACADERNRKAVEISERYADGEAERKALKAARRAAWEAIQPKRSLAAWHATDARAWEAAAVTAAETAPRLGYGRDEAGMRAQCRLLRCIFGNPFRVAARGPSWLAWNDGAVRKAAQAIYDSRAFDRMPLLADALEDAGCADAAILGHCRSGGEHVRGCWVVDLLLGRE